MYEEKKQNLESICQGLLSLGFSRAKAFMNLLMASCSYLEAKSVVALTASRHYHYHYSNISKVSYYLCKNEEGYCNFFQTLLYYFVSFLHLPVSKTASGVMCYSFSQDVCMASKAASACLPDRSIWTSGKQFGSRDCGRLQIRLYAFTRLQILGFARSD
jgi:hypothetical protein